MPFDPSIGVVVVGRLPEIRPFEPDPDNAGVGTASKIFNEPLPFRERFFYGRN